MAVNELDRDYLMLIHQCDNIEDIIAGLRMRDEDDLSKKEQIGQLVSMLELSALDDKWEAAGKDMTPITEAIAAGRTYWKS